MVKCMVTNCKEEAVKYCFDGVFWIRVCKKHLTKFKSFANDNGLTFETKELIE